MQYALENIRDVKAVIALAQEMIAHRDVFDEILEAIEKGSKREQFIGSWVLSRAVEIQSDIMNEAAHQTCITCIEKHQEGGLRRNICRVWQFALPQSDALQMKVLDLAIKLLTDHQQDLAVRVFSITVLEKLLRFFPEIKEEVIFILEREYDQASPSFRVRADRFFKAAKRL